MGQLDFFGQASVFEILVKILALIGGLFAIYNVLRSWLWPARIDLKLADTVELVLKSNGDISAFHLACSFENSGAKIGTIQRIDAAVNNPQGEKCYFRWAFFIDYLPGGTQRGKGKDRHAIAVRPKDNEFVSIQFDKMQDRCEGFTWVEGQYEFEILIWVNAKSPLEDPQTRRRFRAEVTKKLALQVGQPRQEPVFWAIDIVEWSIA